MWIRKKTIITLDYFVSHCHFRLENPRIFLLQLQSACRMAIIHSTETTNVCIKVNQPIQSIHVSTPLRGRSLSPVSLTIDYSDVYCAGSKNSPLWSAYSIKYGCNRFSINCIHQRHRGRFVGSVRSYFPPAPMLSVSCFLLLAYSLDRTSLGQLGHC